MPDQFHLLTGEDGEPLAIAYGPSRHESKTFAIFNGNYNFHSLSDRERGNLCRLLVDTANNSLT